MIKSEVLYCLSRVYWVRPVYAFYIFILGPASSTRKPTHSVVDLKDNGETDRTRPLLEGAVNPVHTNLIMKH